MGRKRLQMNKIRDVLKLSKKNNLNINQIHNALRIPRSTISKYVKVFEASSLKYDNVKELSDPELLEILGLNNQKLSARYNALSADFPKYVQELTRTGVTRYILWSEYLKENPAGFGYSQFCYHFQKWKNASKLSMHIDHKAGDKMYVDFAGKKLSYINPETDVKQEVEIFTAILPASSLIYVEPVISQKKNDWISVNQNALLYYGGVPKVIVPDCLKSAVTKGSKYEPDLNPEYYDFANHYNTVILPARPYKPKDKALVEQAVRIVYQNIFANLRNQVFHSFRELKEAVNIELQKLNSRPMQHLKISRFQLFDKVEKNELQPLPVERYEMRHFKQLKVQSNYHIYLCDDVHYYSVPHIHRNKRVKVIYTAENIEIYLQNIRIAFHKRDKRANRYTTNPEHLPHKHRFILDWKPEKFIDKAEAVGIDTSNLVKEILRRKKHPEQAYKICSGILALVSKYDAGQIEKACHICLMYNNFSYKGVRDILKNGMENLLTDQNTVSKKLPAHSNIRGSEYYAQFNNQIILQGENI